LTKIVKELYPELIDYIFDHCWQYRSELEKKAINHHIGTLKFGNRKNLHPKLIEVRDRHITTDKDALDLLKNGYRKFIENTATRIYKDHKAELDLNLCPECGKIARTPKARQCRFCCYDWH
jgi:hypothetical protein